MHSQKSKGNLWWVSEAIDSRLVRSLEKQGWEVKQIKTEGDLTDALAGLQRQRGRDAAKRYLEKKSLTLDNPKEEPTPDAVLVGNLTTTGYNLVMGYCHLAGLDRFVPFSGDPLINQVMFELEDRSMELGLADFPFKIIPELGNDPQRFLDKNPVEFSSRLELALAPFRGQEAPGRGGGVENPRI